MMYSSCRNDILLVFAREMLVFERPDAGADECIRWLQTERHRHWFHEHCWANVTQQCWPHSVC